MTCTSEGVCSRHNRAFYDLLWRKKNRDALRKRQNAWYMRPENRARLIAKAVERKRARKRG
jgi:hypothetical protein